MGSTKGISWQPRFAVLSDKYLFFSKVGDVGRTVIDYIRLANVVSVETRDPAGDDDAAATTASLSLANESEVSDSGNNTLLTIQTDDLTYIHTVSADTAQQWLEDIRTCVKAAQGEKVRENLRRTRNEEGELAYWRVRSKLMYESDMAQMAVALVILGGFVTDVSEAQILPEDGTIAERLYLFIDVAVTSFFTLELGLCREIWPRLQARRAQVQPSPQSDCEMAAPPLLLGWLLPHAGLNIFAHFDDFAAFWASFSNCFDAFIVVVSVSALSVVASGVDWPPVKMLRLIRVCRILRLFRKLKNLNRIISAVSCAVFPVCNRSSFPRTVTLRAHLKMLARHGHGTLAPLKLWHARAP